MEEPVAKRAEHQRLEVKLHVSQHTGKLHIHPSVWQLQHVEIAWSTCTLHGISAVVSVQIGTIMRPLQGDWQEVRKWEGTSRTGIKLRLEGLRCQTQLSHGIFKTSKTIQNSWIFKKTDWIVQPYTFRSIKSYQPVVNLVCLISSHVYKGLRWKGVK